MDIQTFLLQAVSQERRAELAYLGLVTDLEVRANEAARAFFAEMADYCRLHREEAMTRAGLDSLDQVSDLLAQAQAAPTGERPHLDYPDDPLTLPQAMEIALEAEHRAYELYAAVAETAKDTELCRLAQTFAAEEREHIEALERFYLRQTA